MATMLSWEPFITRRPVPTGNANRSQSWVPAADLERTEDGSFIRMDIPGVDPADLDVSITDNVLAIRGSRRMNNRTVSFERRFTLPENTPAEGISASHELGVLELFVPKPLQPEPQRVAIQVRNGAKSDTGQIEVEAHDASDEIEDHSGN